MAARTQQPTEPPEFELLEFLAWWTRIPLPATMPDQEKNNVRTGFRGADSDALKAAITGLERQYQEVNSDLESVRNRASGLLAATGVITGVVALAAAFTGLFQLRSWLGFGGLVFAAVVVYAAVATTFLAIRAQQVDYWGQAELHPGELPNVETYQSEYAASLYIIWRENLDRLRVPVGYLRDAQVYFRGLIVALGLLVVLTVVTSILGLPAGPNVNNTTASSARITP